MRKLILPILTAALLAGCSKSDVTKPTPPPIVPHYQIDDVAQVLATTLSADNGGWYCVVKALAESLAVPAPLPSPAPFATAGWSIPLSSRTGQLGDFSVSTANPAITYNLRLGYWDHNQLVHSSRDTTTEHLEAYVALDGGVFTQHNGLDGDYGYHASVSRDSTFSVFNLREVDPDTLIFTGTADDSCYALVHSTVTVPNTGLWYLHDNFFDFELHIPKNKLTTAPYPTGGEINWILQVYPLVYNGYAPARTDYETDIFAEARMTFDGTPDALLTIANDLFFPAYRYLYKVNLNTGTITRLN